MMQIAGAIRSLRSGEGLKGQLLRGGVGSVAVKIASTLLNVLMAIVLARLLGAKGFGIYSFVFAVVTIMAIPAQFGLPNLILRETAKAQAEDRWDVIKGLWRWASLIALAISLGLVVAGVLAAWLFSERFSPAQLATFYWGLALVPLIALGNLRGAALRGLRHVVQGQLPEFVLRPGFLIVLVLATHLGLAGRTLTASDAMMLHALASLVAFAIGAGLLLRARPPQLTATHNSQSHPRHWLASAFPLGMVEGMQLINQNVGVIALGIFTSAEEVGIFRVALQGATLVTFGLTAANMVVAPHFARLHAQGDTASLQRLVTFSARAVLLLSIPVAIIFAWLGREILASLFGSTFEAAYWPLVILTLGQLANAATACVAPLLYMTGNERDVALAVAIAALANIIMTPAFALFGQSAGVAVAMAVSVTIWNAILLWQTKRRLPIRVLPI